MAPLLLGYRDPGVLLLTLAGGRPLLLECPPELRVKPAPPAPLAEARPLRQKPRNDWGDVPPPEVPRRTPEIPVDPRTAFRNKRTPTVPAGPRMRSAEPAHVQAAASPVVDIVILSQMPAFRASDQGVKSLLTYLRTAQILVPKVERKVGDGTVIELLPDVFSHLAFAEGTAPDGPPSILEGALWVSPKPAALSFGDPQRTACFRLELVGVRYAVLTEAFTARLHQILHLRPEALTVPHVPARLRSATPRVATEPIPHMDMQEI